MHRLPRPLLAVLAVLAGALGACGGDDLASKPAPAVVAEAFGGGGEDLRSGRLDLRVAFDGKDLTTVQGPFRLSPQGPFAAGRDGALPRFALGADLEAGGRAVSGGAISTGTAAWLTFAGQAFALPRATVGALRDAYGRDRERSGASGLDALGIDPARWLSRPRKAGEATVGGTRTVRVTAGVDVPAVLEDVSRILAHADATGAAGAADAGGLSTGRLGLDLVLTDVNEAQEIEAPARSRPLADLTGALR